MICEMMNLKLNWFLRFGEDDAFFFIFIFYVKMDSYFKFGQFFQLGINFFFHPKHVSRPTNLIKILLFICFRLYNLREMIFV